tara:strand:+ start:2583 stop:4025 length:1443 start_codon:yes stop_codon:yes gene_type:complete
MFSHNKIKRFLKLIESLEKTMVHSKLWNFTRTGLGEIGQGNLFYILNNKNGFKEINFLRLIKSISSFLLVVIIFPIKYMIYKSKLFLNINNSFNFPKTNQSLKIFIGPVDNKNNLKGSNKNIFLNLKKKYEDIIFIPLKPFSLKNIFSLSESNKKIINLTDIFLENPSIFFSWIREIFYIFKMLLITNKNKLQGINKIILILSFTECSLRQSYEIYALINLLIFKLNEYNVNFYTTFEANTFERVLVRYRSNFSNYETFQVSTITDFLTKHYFYSRLINEKGFPNIIYTPDSELYNSSIFKYYSKISTKIIKMNNFKECSLKKIENFPFKFALLCSGGLDANYLVDFIRQLLRYKICDNNEIIVALHPAQKMANYSLKVIKELGLKTTINLNECIYNSQIGIFLSSNSSINALDCNMPLIKVNSLDIFDCNNPLEFVKNNNENILTLDIELKSDDLITLKNFLLDKRIQIRKKARGWFYG